MVTEILFESYIDNVPLNAYFAFLDEIVSS